MILQDDLMSEAALFVRTAADEQVSEGEFYLAVSAVYRTLADIAAAPVMAKELAPAA